MTTIPKKAVFRNLPVYAIAATVVATLVPDTAAAQRLQDQARERSKIIATEKAKASESVDDDAFRPFMYFKTEVGTFNNADFRDYREADPIIFIDVYDTDDRTTVGFTQLSGGFQYDVNDQFTFDLAGSAFGIYGGSGGESGTVFMDRLAFNWSPVNNKAAFVGVTVGRMPFNIGGAEQDYFFDDVIDGAVVDLFADKIGGVRLLVDFFASSFRPDDVNLVSGTKSGTDTIRANGDNNIWRVGAVYENKTLVKNLELRLFGFYADIGATGPEGTGSSRNFGVLAYGNQADNDYTWIAGTRIGYTLRSEKFNMLTYGEFAQSGGIDREAVQVGLFDVETSGSAFGLGVVPKLEVSPSFGIRGILHAYFADGAKYAGSNGARFNHGFTSMKARQVGGFATNRVSGWHPSAYVGFEGVEQSPNNIERIAGTMSINAGVGFDILKKFELDLDFYYFKDTSSTNFDTSRASQTSSEIPYGYTEFDLLAQERYGKTLGIELDAELRWRALPFLVFFAQGGVFLPGDFYSVEVDRSVGRRGSSRTALGGSDNFIGGSLGTVVEF